MEREFVDGGEIIARAAIAAGCNFFAGYPITPASTILMHLMHELPKVGGIAIQCEDEIASAGVCIGASMTGKKVMTATSGPGMSLYSENIGLGIMGEVPMVVVNVQRLGPATGGATTGAEGDVQFVRWITSSGLPLIVLAPTDLVNQYHLTIRAFNLAERFRVPVILNTVKELVLTMEAIDADLLGNTEPIVEREKYPDGTPYIPYEYHHLDKVPAFLRLGGDERIVRFTTSMHDEHGVITKDPRSVDRTFRHLNEKVMAHLDEITCVERDFQEGADTLIIAYGVAQRSAAAAVKTVREEGGRVSILTVFSLWPVPEKEITDGLAGIKRIVVPEHNLGQYLLEVKRLVDKDIEVIGVNRVDGELLDPESIIQQGGLE